MKKTAVLPGDYAQYAGFGHQGYHPGLDDPTQLPSQYYSAPKRYDQPPKWVGKTTAGLLGGALLLGLLTKGIGWRAGRHAARRAREVAALERRAVSAQRVLDRMPERMRQSLETHIPVEAAQPGFFQRVITRLGSTAREGGR